MARAAINAKRTGEESSSLVLSSTPDIESPTNKSLDEIGHSMKRTPNEAKQSSTIPSSSKSSKYQVRHRNGKQNHENVLPSAAEVFTVDDLNFTGYDLPKLVFLCEHRLVLRTRFPKLVVTLFHHPRFSDWIQRADKTSHTGTGVLGKILVDRLVDSINRYTNQPQNGYLSKNKVCLTDATRSRIVGNIIGIGCDQEESVRTNSETSDCDKRTEAVLPPPPRSVNHTLKSYYKWKDTTHPHLELDIQTTTSPNSPHHRTRKRTTSSSHNIPYVRQQMLSVFRPSEDVTSLPSTSTSASTSPSQTTEPSSSSWSKHQPRTIQIT